MRILIADDQEMSRKLLRATLEAAGHTVIATADGVQCLQALEREPVDAIIADILMPRMDGFRLCYEIRHNQRFKDLPFLLYSSTHTSTDDTRLAAEFGADRFVHKPANARDLLEAIVAVKGMPRKRPTVSADLSRELAILKEYSSVLVAKLEHSNTRLNESQERLVQANRELLGRTQEMEEAKLQLEARVRERTAQLEAANKELEAFSYSVSHDLRAPLRHVQGYVEMLARETHGQLAEKPARYLQVIVQATEEMGHLIDDLLALARTARAELRSASVDLNALVRECVRGQEMAARDRHIVWHIPVLPTVTGDLSLLRQVWANLLDNAVKYTRPRDPAEIEIGCAGEEDGRLVLFVRDNGVGFDPQYARKLFGVFQRLHRPDEFEGTGIGLANVHRIIARHGGRTWAEGKLGKGATFYFTLKPSVPP